MPEVEETWAPLDGDSMQHLCLAFARLGPVDLAVYIYIYAVYESGGSGVTFVSPGSTGRSRLQPKGSRVLVTILKPMKMTIVQKNALWQGVTSSSSEPTGWSNDAFICFSAAIYSRSWRS